MKMPNPALGVFESRVKHFLVTEKNPNMPEFLKSDFQIPKFFVISVSGTYPTSAHTKMFTHFGFMQFHDYYKTFSVHIRY